VAILKGSDTVSQINIITQLSLLSNDEFGKKSGILRPGKAETGVLSKI
jgi:hypothetical protein